MGARRAIAGLGCVRVEPARALGVRAPRAGSRRHGARPRHAWTTDAPDRAAALNLECAAYLVVFAALAVVAWRRFGAPYGLYAAVSLAIALSLPQPTFRLLSLPRFGLVVFPLFLALAALTGGRSRLAAAVPGASAILLGAGVIDWSLGQFVA